MQHRTGISQGFATLMLVILLAFIAVLVVAAISLKILVGTERTRSFSDSLQSSYAAESEINDIMARFVGNYPVDDLAINKTLSDGTQLITTTRDENNTTIIDILARREFSSVQLELIKEGTEATTNQDADVVLTLDCTGSMSDCADPAHGNNCRNANSQYPTSLEELKAATIAFLQGLDAISNANVNVGIALFTIDANWLTTSDGTQITPGNNVRIPDIITAVQNGFQKDPERSSACQLVTRSSTAQGTGLRFVNDYFKQTQSISKKQIQILVTDGKPNTAVPNPSCNEMYFIPYLAGDIQSCPIFTPRGFGGEQWNCKPQGSSYALGDSDRTYRASTHSQDNIACMLADTNTRWNGFSFGQRSPAVDNYVLNTFPLPANDSVRQLFEQYATEYFQMQNATGLTDTLVNNVLPEIRSTINNFSIRKVVP